MTGAGAEGPRPLGQPIKTSTDWRLALAEGEDDVSPDRTCPEESTPGLVPTVYPPIPPPASIQASAVQASLIQATHVPASAAPASAAPAAAVPAAAVPAPAVPASKVWAPAVPAFAVPASVIPVPAHESSAVQTPAGPASKVSAPAVPALAVSGSVVPVPAFQAAAVPASASAVPASVGQTLEVKTPAVHTPAVQVPTIERLASHVASSQILVVLAPAVPDLSLRGSAERAVAMLASPANRAAGPPSATDVPGSQLRPLQPMAFQATSVEATAAGWPVRVPVWPSQNDDGGTSSDSGSPTLKATSLGSLSPPVSQAGQPKGVSDPGFGKEAIGSARPVPGQAAEAVRAMGVQKIGATGAGPGAPPTDQAAPSTEAGDSADRSVDIAAPGGATAVQGPAPGFRKQVPSHHSKHSQLQGEVRMAAFSATTDPGTPFRASVGIGISSAATTGSVSPQNRLPALSAARFPSALGVAEPDEIAVRDASAREVERPLTTGAHPAIARRSSWAMDWTGAPLPALAAKAKPLAPGREPDGRQSRPEAKAPTAIVPGLVMHEDHANPLAAPAQMPAFAGNRGPLVAGFDLAAPSPLPQGVGENLAPATRHGDRLDRTDSHKDDISGDLRPAVTGPGRTRAVAGDAQPRNSGRATDVAASEAAGRMPEPPLAAPPLPEDLPVGQGRLTPLVGQAGPVPQAIGAPADAGIADAVGAPAPRVPPDETNEARPRSSSTAAPTVEAAPTPTDSTGRPLSNGSDHLTARGFAPDDLFEVPRTPTLAEAGPIGEGRQALTRYPPIERQIVQMLGNTTDHPVEVTLSPEELGRVKVTLHTQGPGIVLTVVAERPETLDLMRRHIDGLSQELRAIGYSSVSFEFGNSPGHRHSGAPPQQADRPSNPKTDWQKTEPPLPTPMVSARQGATGGGGLDLRL